MYFQKHFRKLKRDLLIPRHCPTADSEELSAYVDGMLEGIALRQVGSHIAHCAECGDAVQELTKLRSALSSVRDVPSVATEEYWTRVFRAARQEHAHSTPGVTQARRAWWPFAAPGRIVAFTATASAFIALLAFVIPATLQSGISDKSRTNSGRPSILQGASRQSASGAVPAELGLNALVESHARMVSEQPSADNARATFVVSDLTARASGEAAAPPLLQNTELSNASGMDNPSVVTSD